MAAFNLPRLLDEHLHAFIAHADFGPLYQRPLIGGQDVCVVAEGRLQDYITAIVNNGVVNHNILMHLFLIYIYRHQLQTPNDRQIWVPNDEIRDYLGAGLEHLAALHQDDQRTTRDGRPLRFGPDALRIIDIQRIVRAYMVPD